MTSQQIADITGQSIRTTEKYEIHDEAYREGAFFAKMDWSWVRAEPTVSPTSMAEHCALAWQFISRTVCPEWNNDYMRRSFFLGYEDAATELADSGEAGYEVLAEAGTVADTEGWIVQSAPWEAKASRIEKALRAIQAAWAGAEAWQVKAEASGSVADRARAEEAQIRAETF